MWTFYYYAGSSRVAERINQNGTTALYFLFSDHLGNTSVVVDSSGAVVNRQLYRAFGAPRYSSGTDLTDYGYTGQRADDSIGLMYYNARWYDPALGRFTQADTVLPDAGNPLAWDRYAYVNNNPIITSDPTGHLGKTVNNWDDGASSPIIPIIIPREDWGARDVGTSTYDGVNPELSYAVNPGGYAPYSELIETIGMDLSDILFRITIHHTGNNRPVNEIQDYHMDEEGYFDIGYHFVIDENGLIFEGRDINVRGNHAWPNTGNVGVALIGDFASYGATPNQLASTIVLAVWLDHEYGIDLIQGHGQVAPDAPGGIGRTPCPERYGYMLLPLYINH